MPPLAPPQPANVRNSNMAHLNPLPPSVFTLTQTAQLEALYTIIRDKETSRGDFLFYSDRIIRLLVEEGLNHLPVVSRTVETPTVSWLLKSPFPKVGKNGPTRKQRKKPVTVAKMITRRADKSTLSISGRNIQWSRLWRQDLRCLHSSCGWGIHYFSSSSFVLGSKHEFYRRWKQVFVRSVGVSGLARSLFNGCILWSSFPRQLLNYNV